MRSLSEAERMTPQQAELVRVRIGESRALTFWDFVSGIERMPWNAYIKAPAPIPDVSTVCIKSRLWHDKAGVALSLTSHGSMKSEAPGFG